MFARTIQSFLPSFKLLWHDRVSTVLTLIPITMGLICYIYLGSTFFSTMMDWGQGVIQKNVSAGGFGTFLYYALGVFLAILTYFFVNFTFVLFISVIASPFNDLLSARVEKIHLKENLPSFAESFEGFGGKIFKTVFNELKKISFIIVLSILSFVMAYIPFLAPVSIFIAIVLLAIEFLDYSWSRREFSFLKCLRDLRKNILPYSIGGGFFFLLISIPVVNLLVPSYGTSFFTTLWIQNHEHSS